MGWTGCYREKGVSNAEFFRGEFECKGTRLLHVESPVVNEVYIAVGVVDKYTYGMVVMCEWGKRKWDVNQNFMYKEMSEEMLPIFHNASDKLLGMLSPVELLFPDDMFNQGQSAKWRLACREQSRKRRDAVPLTRGTVIDIGEPIRFTDRVVRGPIFVVRNGRKMVFNAWNDEQGRFINTDVLVGRSVTVDARYVGTEKQFIKEMIVDGN